jgi:hypothetical protein
MRATDSSVGHEPAGVVRFNYHTWKGVGGDGGVLGLVGALACEHLWNAPTRRTLVSPRRPLGLIVAARIGRSLLLGRLFQWFATPDQFGNRVPRTSFMVE